MEARIRGARGERAVVGFVIDRDPADRGHDRADRRRRGRLGQAVVRRIRAAENEARYLHGFIRAHRGVGKGGRDVRHIQRNPAAGGHADERRGRRAHSRLRGAVIGFIEADDTRHRQRGARDRGRRGGLRERVVGGLGARQRQTADRHRFVGAYRGIGKFSEHIRGDEAHRRDVGRLYAYQHGAARHHGRIRLPVEDLVYPRDARDRDRLRVDRGTQRRLPEAVVGAVVAAEGESRHLDRALGAHLAIVEERRRTRGIDVHHVGADFTGERGGGITHRRRPRAVVVPVAGRGSAHQERLALDGRLARRLDEGVVRGGAAGERQPRDRHGFVRRRRLVGKGRRRRGGIEGHNIAADEAHHRGRAVARARRQQAVVDFVRHGHAADLERFLGDVRRQARGLGQRVVRGVGADERQRRRHHEAVTCARLREGACGRASEAHRVASHHADQGRAGDGGRIGPIVGLILRRSPGDGEPFRRHREGAHDRRRRRVIGIARLARLHFDLARSGEREGRAPRDSRRTTDQFKGHGAARRRGRGREGDRRIAVGGVAERIEGHRLARAAHRKGSVHTRGRVVGAVTRLARPHHHFAGAGQGQRAAGDGRVAAHDGEAHWQAGRIRRRHEAHGRARGIERLIRRPRERNRLIRLRHFKVRARGARGVVVGVTRLRRDEFHGARAAAQTRQRGGTDHGAQAHARRTARIQTKGHRQARARRRRDVHRRERVERHTGGERRDRDRLARLRHHESLRRRAGVAPIVDRRRHGVAARIGGRRRARRIGRSTGARIGERHAEACGRRRHLHRPRRARVGLSEVAEGHRRRSRGDRQVRRRKCAEAVVRRREATGRRRDGIGAGDARLRRGHAELRRTRHQRRRVAADKAAQDRRECGVSLPEATAFRFGGHGQRFLRDRDFQGAFRRGRGVRFSDRQIGRKRAGLRRRAGDRTGARVDAEPRRQSRRTERRRRSVAGDLIAEGRAVGAARTRCTRDRQGDRRRHGYGGRGRARSDRGHRPHFDLVGHSGRQARDRQRRGRRRRAHRLPRRTVVETHFVV